MAMRFKNRTEGGTLLARSLMGYADRPDVLVLALPRGGVPVGYEVAERLHVPLHVFLVRKLGVPGHDEYAMGAMASGGVILLNEDVVEQLGISREDVQQVINRERRELERRETAYCTTQKRPELCDRTIILVDDGLATGSTMKVAVSAVRQCNPRRIVVAVPVAPASIASEFHMIADEFVCVLAPEVFFAVGQWYADFEQTTDDEVCELLRQAAIHFHGPVPVSSSPDA